MEFESSKRLFVAETDKFRDRRGLAREAIRAAIIGEDLEVWFLRLKDAVVYDRMAFNEKEMFRRFCSDVRQIYRGWSLLTKIERHTFLEGPTVYTSVAASIRNRSKGA